ncbi:CU044_2847 family protein [Streptomyces wedmorensis]|uniref:CU044_2847 family protein n=1 Tax=Streptomyces wedmorensis TaxID=43759 RepID=A0ABW6J5R0_STRWE
MARAALQQLRKARPDVITVEFGVDLAFEAGAVITESGACRREPPTGLPNRTVARSRRTPGRSRTGSACQSGEGQRVSAVEGVGGGASDVRLDTGAFPVRA